MKDTKNLLRTKQKLLCFGSIPSSIECQESVCGSRQLAAIPLVVAFATPLVQPEFGFESKSSQCREFAAEGIRLICPAMDFVMDVVESQVPLTPQQIQVFVIFIIDIIRESVAHTKSKPDCAL